MVTQNMLRIFQETQVYYLKDLDECSLKLRLLNSDQILLGSLGSLHTFAKFNAINKNVAFMKITLMII